MLQLGNPVLDGLLLQILRDRCKLVDSTHLESMTYVDETARLDTDRERSNVGKAAFKLDTVGHRLQTENPRTRGKEVAGIIVGVETDEITVQDAEKDLASDWEDTVMMSVRESGF